MACPIRQSGFRHPILFSFLALVVAFGESRAQAGVVVFGTGLSGGVGEIDTGTVSGSGNPTIVAPVDVGDSINFWASPVAGTQWVSAVAATEVGPFNTNALTAPVGDYSFEFSFLLPDDVTALEMAVGFYVDNVVATMKLNGIDVPFSAGAETTLGTVSVTDVGRFVPGANTFQVVVTNLQGFPGAFNPMGLDLAATVTFVTETTVVPEPSSLVIVGFGLAIALFVRRLPPRARQ